MFLSWHLSTLDTVVQQFLLSQRFETPTRVSAEGIEFETDGGLRVVSFPQQSYDNGVTKNSLTSQKYKAVVRILKNVRNELIDQGTLTKDSMSSFFLACLIWNVLPDALFQQDSYHEATKNIIRKVWNDMRNSEKAKNYAEVSNLKGLFKGHSNRTYKQAEDFMLNCWQFLGY